MFDKYNLKKTMSSNTVAAQKLCQDICHDWLKSNFLWYSVCVHEDFLYWRTFEQYYSYPQWLEPCPHVLRWRLLL